MESNAQSSRSSASTSRVLSMTAMTTRVTKVGNFTFVETVPDFATRTLHATLAAQYERDAVAYDNKARAARNGSPIKTYTFDKEINRKNGTLNLTQDFIDERAKNESKVLRITRLPVRKYNSLKKWF